MRANDEVQHLYSFGAVYPDAHWGKPAWFWMPAAQSSVFCVCVCVFLVGRSLVCSTCVWHYCDKAAQPLWGDGECQRLESRSEQLPNIWWNEKHTRWMAGLLTPQHGSRAVGGGQVKPQLCVWNITLSLFSFCFLPNVHISTHILKHHSTHTGISSNNTVFTGIIRCLFSSFLTAGEMLELLYLEHSWLKTHPL